MRIGSEHIRKWSFGLFSELAPRIRKRILEEIEQGKFTSNDHTPNPSSCPTSLNIANTHVAILLSLSANIIGPRPGKRTTLITYHLCMLIQIQPYWSK